MNKQKLFVFSKIVIFEILKQIYFLFLMMPNQSQSEL